MTKLPPVRKRTDYASVRSDDLTMALFYDRVNGTAPATPGAITKPTAKPVAKPAKAARAEKRRKR